MTHIVELSKEWTTHAWLCELHIERRIAKGWKVVRKGTVEHGCDDCAELRQEDK